MFLQNANNDIFRFYPGVSIRDVMISSEDILHHIFQVLYLSLHSSLGTLPLSQESGVANKITLHDINLI